MGRKSKNARTRARRWIFTINNFNPNDVINLRHSIDDGAKYVIFGREHAPSTNTRHLQGYLEFKNARSLLSLKRTYPTAHFEPARGTYEENREYCSKDGDYEEYGEAVGQGKRTDLEEIREEIKAGSTALEIAESHFSRWVIYRKSFAAYRDLLHPPQEREVMVYLLVGDTGVGKTRYVFDRARRDGCEVFVAPDPELRWFDGYCGQSRVLIDDYRGAASFEWVLRLLDRYPMRVPIKGSFVAWLPTQIWITSNLEIEGWYPGVDVAPLSRRIAKTFHFTRGLGDIQWDELRENLDNKLF